MMMEKEKKMTVDQWLASNPEDARELAVTFTAARIVWAESVIEPEQAEAEKDAALRKLWTGDDEEDVERVKLLLDSLTDHFSLVRRLTEELPGP